MVTCPACEGNIDVDEEDVDEGDTISCDECGAALKVIGTAPLELESAEEAETTKKTKRDSSRKRRRMPTRTGNNRACLEPIPPTKHRTVGSIR